MGRSTSRRLAPALHKPLHEPLLERADRRARGVYYTPPEIVRQLVRLTLDMHCRQRPLWRSACRESLRILDPACGAGAMLVEAAARIASYGRTADLFGIDSDPHAVAAARTELPAAEFWIGDALFDDRLDRLAPLDVIVGNPPYLNIRQLAKSLPPQAALRLRSRYMTARGNFDLYVPFIERSLELLAPGGRCGLIIPNKWATLDYARPIRELLLANTTVEHVVDLSAVRVFADASVYPHIVVFTKKRPARSHFVRLQVNRIHTKMRQRLLSPSAISFAASLDVESRVKTKPLGEVASLSCGTPGYSAQRVAAVLRNATEGVPNNASAAEFITSGNIDRYAISPGSVRFLGRTYQRPLLPLDSPALTDRQRTLFASPKIVIAGLSQRLEVAWDDRGLALGVQVFAATQWQIDPHYLLALLNSKLLSYLFRTRYAAKQLAGGYMAINKGQLARLPIALPRRTSFPLVQKAGQPSRLSYENDTRIDQFVYRLYRLTKAEVATVEAHFANLGRRAA